MSYVLKGGGSITVYPIEEINTLPASALPLLFEAIVKIDLPNFVYIWKLRGTDPFVIWKKNVKGFIDSVRYGG